MKNKKGITLIALVITIVILLILTGVAISTIRENGLFSRAKESAFKTKMAAYKEQADMYVSWKISQTMDTNTKTINSGEILKNAIDQEIVTDITKDDVSIDIKDIIKEISNKEKEYIVVYKGELCYVSNEIIDNNSKQARWCNDIGIKILEYNQPEGIAIKTGKYECINGLFICTPKLDEGFEQEYTRFLNVQTVNGVEYLTPGNWANDKTSNEWYDYSKSNWANVYVEEEGQEIYYVWIPRYCFTLDQDKQKADVKFIDIENNYKELDENGNIVTYTIEQLNEKEGKTYQIPEAFQFNGEDISGYWMMKYTAAELSGATTVGYDMTISKGILEIKNIKINTNRIGTNAITKYTIAINGQVVQEITDSSKISNINSEKIKISNLKAGNNVINVTALNANGEIIGSMTKTYEPAVVNKPEFAGFNEDTTFYVTYDDEGKEHSTIPISNKTFPQYWYEYGENRWANIVTRNNDEEVYYVWIPRYEFMLNQSNQRSTVKFLSGTSTKADPGYQIPEAFTFNGQQIPGYWIMKYTAAGESTTRFGAEVTATSSSIRTKGITGTSVTNGQVYNYYLNGELKGTKTNADDTFEYTGLTANTKYTVLVEIRNTSNDLVGTIVKQISTIDVNKPVLEGFNTIETDSNGNKLPVAYYVLYDESGTNSTIGSKITNNGSNIPNNWYNYSQSKWANIVITDGEIVNGQIQNATKTTYYTWIPRYEFKITSSQQAQPALGRTEVRFLSGTTSENDIGYQIPEAFKFDGKEIPGYWIMKYTAGQ